jgi:carbonic anhydrase
MEAHCVHTKNGHEGKYGVVGVFFQVGDEQNSFFASFEGDYPAVGGSYVRGETDFNGLTAGLNMHHYWSYDGSFTTPPCTEAVDWYVLMEHSMLSDNQFTMLQTATGHAGGMADANGNFRPPQPLNGREVLGCKKLHWYPYEEMEWSTYVKGSSLVCEMGQEQSPVDLPECHESKSRPGALDFSQWESNLIEVTMENSHGIKITPTGGQESRLDSEMTGNQYTLAQCHFHWGSEHTVNSHQYKVESHCVQLRSDESQRAGVIGVFWDVSDSAVDHDFFLPLQDHFPAAGMADGTFHVDFVSFFNGLDLSEFWNYHGSLTTPPCSEIVDWHVLMSRPTLSGAQFRALQSATGEIEADGNFRPPQDLNGRFIDGCLSLAVVTNPQAPDLYPYSADAWSWEVEDAHALCSAGLEQSPIALSSCLAEPQPELGLHWGERQVTIHADGELTVDLTQAAHSMIRGTEYHMIACAFHAGSEHQVDGNQFHLEMQCVHTQQLGGHAVVAQLWHVGEWDSAGSAFLSQVTDHLPLDSAAVTNLNFDLQLDHVDKTRYWSYEGSMTMPPCTEGVHWFVLMDTLEMSAAQLELITGTVEGNFRPPQDLHNRHVVGCAQHADWYAADNGNWAYSTHDHHVVCEMGQKQSPIDLNVCAHVMDRPAIDLNWGSQSFTMTNNGHTIVAEVSGSSANTVIEGTHYTLAQCHFHWGSEHFVEGMQQRMEVHCVHTRDGHDRYGVIGMFYDVGVSTNTFLGSIEDDLPLEGDSVIASAADMAVVFDGTDLRHYWSYEGSFTTPPCTEAVDWYVLMDHAEISQGQYNTFQRSIGMANPEGGNFRPPQPLHDRLVEGCVLHDVVETSMCEGGMQQSPIDLEQCVGNEKAQLELQVSWGVETVHITSDGDLQLELTNPGSATSFLKGTEYTLLGCEFRAGSEHTVNEEQFDMELQCVNEGHDDRYGIVAIFFEVGGSEHRFLQDIDSDLALLPAEEGVNFDHLWAGLDRTKYWDYQGSFTVDPCEEKVDWFVMMQQAQLSAQQLTNIQNAIGVIGGNFRTPQALHGRAVGGCVPVPEWYPYHSGDWSDGVEHADSICSTGMRQSPVDLTECAVRSAQPTINMNVGVQDVGLTNDGHTVKLSLTNPPVATMVGDVAYTLQQCHFHWGSEHSVEHMQQRFEAHCVHTLVLDSDHYGVVGVFFRVGDAQNQFFTPFEDSLMAGEVSTFQANINLLTAGLDTRHYWSYEGSFTTPPCTEAVTWMVMMDHSAMSMDQFDKFQEAIGWEGANGNFRPPQPLHGRTISGCLAADYFPEATTTTTSPPPPYVEEHSGACMGGWLGNNLRTGSVWGCHLACLELPACGYFSYDAVSNTCARYSPFQRCPEDTSHRYPTYQSFRMNRPIFENPREVSTHAMVHAGPCAAGWLSTQNARMDTVDDCAQWCAGHLICRYFAFSATSQMCALYSAYSMCPARTDSRYSNTDWMSYVLYTEGEEVHPAAPVPEENMNFFFIHQGHCAAGWMSGHNINVNSLEECITHCFTTPTCGYVSYSEAARTCSLYRGNALCPADSNYPDFASYRVAIV